MSLLTSGPEPEAHAREPRTVFTNGVFDLFHDGHANLLRRAAAEGDRLIVGVSSDASNFARKRPPLQPWSVRAARVAEHPSVDEVLETPWSIDLTRAFYLEHGIDVQVQGDAGSDFGVAEELGLLKVIGRTQGISTTQLIALIEHGHGELLDGGQLNEVRRVHFEGEDFVIKDGHRRVARDYPIDLPARRIRDEHRAIVAFRSRLPDPRVVTEPVWTDGEDVLILRSAPRHAGALVDDLRAGKWDRSLLAGLVRHVRTMHEVTRDDEELRRGFARNPGYQDIKLGVQCREATDDPDLRPLVLAHLERSLEVQRVLLHGDLAPKNILCFDDRVMLIDFEESGYGDPALDVGYLFAHLLLAGIAGDRQDETTALLNDLLAVYLERPWVDDPELTDRIGAYIGTFLVSRLDSAAPARTLPAAVRPRVRALSGQLLREPRSLWTSFRHRDEAVRRLVS
ncbi:MAG: phosphotransferase [Nitriliruptoraceae bacterium]|nr:phosphotransferase [Nitriliruptoraceae bacterium]